ncbi:transcriptional regulator [Streptomyces niveiscabiei]|uniref:transcriptional regulator n=1 Tax=Streptomyces niveiscabiei TaxID=164115 RepID=UPI0029B49ADF|nr:transcriptional regulator [Streptomyces niveiscabiei]MDX3382594.1 transcriptional regulator [Streptomyces niveiscabiei]
MPLPVLHALRCAGAASPTRIGAFTGLAEPDVESSLIDLGVEGFVTRSYDAWSLTDAGRAENLRRITAELDASGARDSLRAAFQRFLVLNPELLDLCTAWQLRPVDGSFSVNDHSDPAYDARVLDRFTDLDRRFAPVGDELAAALPRFGRYRVRLAGALERAVGGEREFVTDSTASYHTVWAELHEDLLVTLGLPR